MKKGAIGSTRRRIGAIARRDWRIQLSYQFQLLTRLLSALFTLLTFFFIGRLVTDSALPSRYDGGYFEFVLVGFVVTTFAAIALAGFSQSIAAEQQAGTLELLLASSAPLGTILAGSLVVPLAIAAGQMTVFVAVGWLLSPLGFGLVGWLLALPLLILTIATFCAFGVGSAALIVLTKRGDPFTNFILQATTLFAGALFPVALLPGPLQVLARLFPAFYGFEGIRAVLLGGAGFMDILDELAILLGFCAVLMPLAVWVFALSLKAARVTGTLGNA